MNLDKAAVEYANTRSFGEMLLDFACQWNMEHEGKNYEYKLKEGWV